MVRGLSPRTRRTYAFDLLCAYRWMSQAKLQPEELTGMRIGELRDLSIHAMEGSEEHGFSLRVPVGKPTPNG